MLPNILMLVATAFIPMIIGYIWFHPKVFGGETWYNVAKLTGEDRSEVSNLKLLSTLVFNFFLAVGLYNQVVHSMDVLLLVGGDSELLRTGVGAEFMAEYGQNHFSFGHGVIHAIFPTTAFIIVPALAYVTIFEKKSFKYFLVYTGYWAISLMLMGGVLCQWGYTQV